MSAAWAGSGGVSTAVVGVELPAGMSVRPARPDDEPALTELLTRTFAADPLVSAMVAPAPDPAAALEHMHRVELREHFLAGEPGLAEPGGPVVDVACDDSGEIIGVALWEAPAVDADSYAADAVGADASVGADAAAQLPADSSFRTAAEDIPASQPDSPLQGVSCGGVSFDPAIMGEAQILIDADGHACEGARPAERHWYAIMLAVSERARGRGVGGALLGYGVARADRDGLPAHLESTTPSSARLYERLGFEHVGELHAHPDLPVYWAMTRPARPQTSGS